MEQATANMTPATAERREAPLFTDGLGDRSVAVDAPTGDLLQILRIRAQLLAVPSFEFALRERAARLANFRHASYARVRRIDRHPTGLAIVGDHVEGTRLSEMLRIAHDRKLHLDMNAAVCLIRQLVPAVALLHENARDVAHGLIAPERLIVTPRARLVIVDHVMGSAVEQLQYNRERLWQDLRVSVPASVGATRFDHRADVMSIGVTALSLVLGRPIAHDEYPHRLASLLNDARGRIAGRDDQPLPDSLYNWIARALQLDVRQGFLSATEAQIALDEALSEAANLVAAPVALETFLSRYVAALLDGSKLHNVSAPLSVPSPVGVARPHAVAPPVAATEIAADPEPATAAQPHVAVQTHLMAQAPAAPVLVPTPGPHVVNKPEPVVESDAATIAAAGRDIGELLRDFDLGAPAQSSTDAAVEAVRESRWTPKPGLTGWRRTAVVALAIFAAGEGVVIGARAYRKPVVATLGTLSLQSNPSGIAVFVDGVAHGNTPARLSLTAGSHLVELRGRGVPRVIPVSVTAGVEASQYLEIPETPTSGILLVQSDPAGAHVSVDGVDRGIAPVNVAELAPGDHEVVLQAENGPVVRQHVTIQAGITASILAPVSTAAPGPVSGWLSIKAPVSVEIRESGRMLGTTDADRVMMAAGRHELELVNETLGYRVTRVVQVPAGKTAALSIEMPQGVINLNASPWAEVWIDGRRVGETPIGNLPISIGPHEVVFRHPQLGEKRQAVSVTLKAPVRLSVEMK
jgi:hypothetical protein